jgi:carbonic anhydrase
MRRHLEAHPKIAVKNMKASRRSPAFFYAFQNIDENVRHQLQKLRAHPWIPESVAVRGFVYDVTSGRLREIKDA